MTRIPKDEADDDGGCEDEYPCTETFDYQELVDRMKRSGEIEVRNDEY